MMEFIVYVAEEPEPECFTDARDALDFALQQLDVELYVRIRGTTDEIDLTPLLSTARARKLKQREEAPVPGSLALLRAWSRALDLAEARYRTTTTTTKES
jgi:hypothetical protein